MKDGGNAYLSGELQESNCGATQTGVQTQMDFFLAMSLWTSDIDNLIGLLWEQMKLWGEEGPWNYVEWLVLSRGYRDMRRLP